MCIKINNTHSNDDNNIKYVLLYVVNSRRQADSRQRTRNDTIMNYSVPSIEFLHIYRVVVGVDFCEWDRFL